MKSYSPLICRLVTLLIMLPSVAKAGDGRLQIGGYAMLLGGSCQVGNSHVLAGSRYFIVVDNGIDRPRQQLVSGWPQGYTLEAALDLLPEQSFVATPGLIERLEPTRYISGVNRLYERFLLENSAPSIDLRALNLKEFVITIPWDLAGHTLSLRVRFVGDSMKLESWPTSPLKIIAPCDRSDSARIVASRIYECWLARDGTRGVTIADSMLEAGLTDPAGWEWAQCCARNCGQYEKALIYLDRVFADFGTVGAGLDAANPPRLNPSGTRDPQHQEMYNQLRRQIQQAKAEYEQRQQNQSQPH